MRSPALSWTWTGLKKASSLTKGFVVIILYVVVLDGGTAISISLPEERFHLYHYFFRIQTWQIQVSNSLFLPPSGACRLSQ
jgi:hypothetical protein